MTTVHIASPLLSYTEGRTPVEAAGSTLTAILADLERRYPGIRFRVVDEQDRIRPHILFFVGERPAALSTRVKPGDDVHIVAALSGG